MPSLKNKKCISCGESFSVSTDDNESATADHVQAVTGGGREYAEKAAAMALSRCDLCCVKVSKAESDSWFKAQIQATNLEALAMLRGSITRRQINAAKLHHVPGFVGSEMRELSLILKLAACAIDNLSYERILLERKIQGN